MKSSHRFQEHLSIQYEGGIDMLKEICKPKILLAKDWKALDALDDLERKIQKEYEKGERRAEGGHQLVYDDEEYQWIASQLMVPYKHDEPRPR